MFIIFENANFDLSKNVLYRYRGNTVVFVTVSAVNHWHRSPLPRYRCKFSIFHLVTAIITAVSRPVSLSKCVKKRSSFTLKFHKERK